MSADASFQGFIPDFVSTYPPRKGGIVEFTKDTVSALGTYEDDVESIRVQAIDKDGLDYGYPVTDRDVIDQMDPDSWVQNCAERIIERARTQEKKGFRVVGILEHEYGLDGDGEGKNFNRVSQILSEEEVAHVAVLHTVLENPNDHQLEVLQGLGETCDRVVILTPSAHEILEDVYGIEHEKIIYIPHGVPESHKGTSMSELKDKWGLKIGRQYRRVISTVGLLSEGKGIEYGLRAFSDLLDEVPESFQDQMVYIVAGQTHPEIVKREGEKYREKLVDIAIEEGLNPVTTKGERLGYAEANVIFLDRYLSDKEFAEIIKASDVLLLPYLDPQQTSSGPLFYGVGLGTPVVASRFAGAMDLFTDETGNYDGSGVLVEIRDEESIKEGLKHAFSHAPEIALRGYRKGVSMGWSVVGREYVNLFREVALHAAEREGSRVPFFDED